MFSNPKSVLSTIYYNSLNKIFFQLNLFKTGYFTSVENKDPKVYKGGLKPASEI